MARGPTSEGLWDTLRLLPQVGAKQEAQAVDIDVLLADLMHGRATGLRSRVPVQGAGPTLGPAPLPQRVAAPRPHSSPLDPPGIPGPLTSSWVGLVAADRDRPRDMFTASAGTEETDMTHMVTLRGLKEEV